MAASFGSIDVPQRQHKIFMVVVELFNYLILLIPFSCTIKTGRMGRRERRKNGGENFPGCGAGIPILKPLIFERF